MKKILLLLIFCTALFSVNSFAQKQAVKWYFGNNAAMDFLSGTPVPFSGSAMTMLEGVASIADTAGNTLFYTNGYKVWNKNNLQMPNGTGLLGDNNSAQAAIIVPWPGNPNQYFIFTTPTWGTGELRYSVVDMTLLGGLGDVTSKNVALFSNSTEKVTAVYHANGTDIWVIGHEWLTNNFYSYLVTAAGVNTTPVITSSGTIASGTLGFAGYMKASHKGHKLAYACTVGMDLVELFDFDNATGIPSNPVTINSIDNAYGLEFSPDDSKLYVTEENPQIICQWDVNAGSAAAIIASQVNLTGSGGDAFAALQLGPDGKIYMANRFSNKIGVINLPNAAGTACNFTDDVITLTSGSNQYGLPNYFQSYFDSSGVSLNPQSAFNASDTTICQKFCMDFFDQSANDPTSWEWSFPGGVPSSSTDQHPTQICYNNPGFYDVTLVTTNAYGTDTLTLSGYITVYSTPPFPTITQNGNVLTCSNASSYQWQFNSVDIPGATSQSYTATQTGYYTVIISDENGCVSSTTLFVEVTGIDNAISENEISIYPNPSSGKFVIEYSGAMTTGKISIDLVNTLGQKVFSSLESQSIGTSHWKKEIDVSYAVRGVYYLEIKSTNLFVRKKIVISHPD